MTMQTLVLAHAAFGHNHFFKNNSSFTQWTDPSGIMDYLSFAKRFIAGCEERYGVAAVESILDSAHALQNIGVDRVKRRRARSFRKEEERLEERMRERERTFNDLWRTVPGTRTEQATPMDERKRLLGLPEENILYFIEKHAPKLKSWEREVIRIVRNIGQYFYPQRYVKTMNEGCATWVHYTILNRMHSRGLITDSSMFEFLQSHTNVVFQPNFDDVRYSGFNPYALGFAIMRDIERIAERPTPEDRRWFPDFAGQGKGIEVLRNAWANYRDESFILQFLSPNVMRDFKMFHLLDHESNETFVVGDIHDDEGYRNVRRALSRLYDPSHTVPSIEITDMDVDGSRALTLTHHIKDGIRLDEDATLDVLLHIQELWGYDVEILEVTEDGEVIARID